MYKRSWRPCNNLWKMSVRAKGCLACPRGAGELQPPAGLEAQAAIARAAFAEDAAAVRELLSEGAVPDAASLTGRHRAVHALVMLGLTRELLNAGLSASGLSQTLQEEWSSTACLGNKPSDTARLIRAGFAVSPFVAGVIHSNALRSLLWQEVEEALGARVTE